MTTICADLERFKHTPENIGRVALELAGEDPSDESIERALTVARMRWAWGTQPGWDASVRGDMSFWLSVHRHLILVRAKIASLKDREKAGEL